MLDISQKQKLFINGEFVSASSDFTLDSVNPANLEVNTQVSEADQSDINLALESSRSAQKELASWEPTKRQNKLLKLAGLVQKNTDLLAKYESLETGKLFKDSQAEIYFSGEILKYFAGWSNKISGSTYFSAGSNKFTIREPLGTVAAIVPWNFPFSMATWKVAPCLAFGNSIILKPAETSSLTALCYGQLAIEAGFPKGALNVLTGRGSHTGRLLTESKKINKISFTGSPETGKNILKNCSQNLIKSSMELGGKSAHIIFDDANMKAALNVAFAGIVRNKGEVCTAGSRLLVHEKVYDQVLDFLSTKANNYPVGDPFDDKTKMGPLANKNQFDKVLNYIKLGQEEGANLLTGSPDDATKLGMTRENTKGYFIKPTIFTDVTPNMRIFQEEIFGPVLCVTKFRSDDEALELANNTQYGLAAGVWTQNLSRAMRFTKELESGIVWVNTYSFVDPCVPFGGCKQSGFGRELGEAAVHEYTQLKTVWMQG